MTSHKFAGVRLFDPDCRMKYTMAATGRKTANSTELKSMGIIYIIGIESVNVSRKVSGSHRKSPKSPGTVLVDLFF